MKYQLLNSRYINPSKWNALIHNNKNDCIFFEFGFIDTMSHGHWDAIIVDDYKCVVPLPFKSILGVKLLYTPAFIPYLGMVPYHEEMLNEINHIIIQRYHTIFYSANFEFNNFECIKRTNFFIDLKKSYESIRRDYHPSVSKNLNKSLSRNASIVENIPMKVIIQLYKDAYGSLNKINELDYENLSQISSKYLSTGNAFTIGVCDENNELVYGAIFLKDSQRIYYLLAAPNEQGRYMRAAYFCIDYVIKKYANSTLKFDFEGSDIPNVAQFYKSFGPQTEYYFFLKKEHFFYRLIHPIKKLFS